MDPLKEIDEKMGLVESILTKTEIIIKKHWKLLLLIAFCAFIYWAFTLPPEVVPEEEFEPIEYYSIDPITQDTIWE